MFICIGKVGTSFYEIIDTTDLVCERWSAEDLIGILKQGVSIKNLRLMEDGTLKEKNAIYGYLDYTASHPTDGVIISVRCFNEKTQKHRAVVYVVSADESYYNMVFLHTDDGTSDVVILPFDYGYEFYDSALSGSKKAWLSIAIPRVGCKDLLSFMSRGKFKRLVKDADLNSSERNAIIEEASYVYAKD